MLTNISLSWVERCSFPFSIRDKRNFRSLVGSMRFLAHYSTHSVHKLAWLIVVFPTGLDELRPIWIARINLIF